jgi:hypothetical protein
MLTAQYLASQTPAKNERENLIVKIRKLMHALRLIRAAWCTHVQIRQTPHHKLALTRCMWYNTKTQTHRDMRRMQWGQNAQMTTREVSFSLMLTDIHETSQNAQQHRSKEANLFPHVCN